MSPTNVKLVPQGQELPKPKPREAPHTDGETESRETKRVSLSVKETKCPLVEDRQRPRFRADRGRHLGLGYAE